jgi:hypothetical protein
MLIQILPNAEENCLTNTKLRPDESFSLKNKSQIVLRAC